jgi:branched-chain amino acid transport system permease protein
MAFCREQEACVSKVGAPRAPGILNGYRKAFGARHMRFVGRSALLAVLLLMPLIEGGYWLFTFALCYASAIAVLALSFLVRYAGEVSIGHSVFVAVGAYTVALFERYLGLPFLLSLLCAAVFGALTSMAFAYPTRRLSGIYLAVATMVLVLSLPEFLLHFSTVTGGFGGLQVRQIAVPWVPEPLQHYYIPLFALLLITVLLRQFRKSHQAMALLMMRTSVHAGESLGIRRSGARLATMGISGALAAISGALTVFVSSNVAPNSFTLWTSIFLLVGSVTSTYSLSLAGSLVGAAFLTIVPMKMAAMGDWVPVLYGATLLATILLANVLPAWRASRSRREQT